MSLRSIERNSIRAFLVAHKDKLEGRVLDFGSGQQPYRTIVEKAGGDYVPWDDPAFAGSTTTWKHTYPLGLFDAVICTQVLQYVDEPVTVLGHIRHFLAPDGCLLITGPTNWPVVEEDDKWRWTTAGIEKLLYRAGFKHVQVGVRAEVTFEQERWSLGWQAIAQE